MICDTNNFSKGADKIIIGNNKSPRSLGLIFYLLARGYCKARGLATKEIPDLEWWTSEDEEEKEARKKERAIFAEPGASYSD
jgi:ribosomal protein S2